jgi:hypothetical protein
MVRLWITSLVLLALGSAAVAAPPPGKFGSGPAPKSPEAQQEKETYADDDEDKDDVKYRSGGISTVTGRGTQVETVHNPKTGKFERRSITFDPRSERIVEREQVYDPKTGTFSQRARQVHPWTGQSIETRRERNSINGDSVQSIGMLNPTSGQRYGFVRRTQVDPMTGTVRRDVAQFNTPLAAPGTGGYHANTIWFNPYTGQMVQGYPHFGYGPP